MKSVPTVHPGEVLRKQFLTPMGISQCALAHAAGMSTVHIKDIVLGRRDVTVDTDTRLASAKAASSVIQIPPAEIPHRLGLVS
jgi:addiction module HigA family antidote